MKSLSKLNLNNNPATTNNGEILFAKNIVATTDQKAVQNEDGFLCVKTIDGVFIGKVEIPNGYVVFYKGTVDTILYHNSDTNVDKVITSEYLHFDKTIKGKYTYDAEENLLITMSEGVDSSNETRILNLTKCSTTLTENDVRLLDLIPNITYPTITSEVVAGGRLLSGTYQLSISYETEKGNYSNYSILGEPIYVFGNIKNNDHIGHIIDYKIHLAFANLDTRYKNFKIAILFKGEDEFEKTYETDIISTSVTDYNITSVSSLKSTDILSILISDISYIKDQDHTSFNSSMFRGNVKTVDYVGLDTKMKDIASKVSVKLTTRTVGQFTEVSNNKRHFKEGEVYALYIGCFDYKGNFVNAYPVYWKTGDTTMSAPTHLGDTIDKGWIHKIPYLTGADKKVSNITMTLPSDINTLLGPTLDKIITSFCYFYAQHDVYNSKVLGQGFVIRDTHINDFNDNQTYKGGFRSNTKLRFYSFELLFNKASLSNAHLQNFARLGGFDITNYLGEYTIADLDGDPWYRIYNPEGSPLRKNTYCYDKIFADKDVIPSDHNTVVNINNIDYATHDNVVTNNIASDGFHRLNMTPTEVAKLLGGTAEDPLYQTGLSPNDYDLNWEDNYDNDFIIEKSNPLNNNLYKMAMVDLISNNDYFFEDIYLQKLAICSPIIPKTNLTDITLAGDFFYGNFTFRLTAPLADIFQYGTNDMDKQGEDRVHKIIISVPIESRFNIRARYKGINDYQKVFAIESPTETANIQSLLDIPYKYDNFINTATGKGYSLSANYIGYDANTYQRETDIKSWFYNRIIRSNVNSTESNSLGWRKYKSDSYKDLPVDRGSIMIMESDERTIYAQQLYSLSILFVKDTMSSTSEGTSYLGSSDIFDRDPIEVLFDKNGYIGCNNRFGAIITPFGYAVVDSVRKNVFLVKTNEPKKLSDSNVEAFFITYLKEDHTNPYDTNGIAMMYDDLIKSLFLTQNGDDPFTIHYNFPNQGWLSFHDYIPDQYVMSRVDNYVLKGTKIYKRNANNKCIFFDIPYKSHIIYMFNAEYETYKQILGLMWNTMLKQDNNLLYDRTIDSVVVFNDTQCSNVVDINNNVNWFDTKSGVFKKDVWYLNDLKDMVLNDLQPFMDADYNIINANIKPSKNNWFELSQFMSKWIGVKFVYNNDFINPSTREISKVSKTGFSQLSFVLNDYDVNAIKALR